LETKHSQPQPQPDSFYLIQRPSLFQSGLLGLRSEALKSVSDKLYLEMNPEDARSLKIEEGETVQVSTPEGQSLQIKVKFSSKPVPGVMTIPYPSPLIGEKGINSVKVERLKRS
jgi:anaerobic selenocysteine-containing dehydrogenase